MYPVCSLPPSLWATLLDRPSPESFMQPLGSATTVSSYRQGLAIMTHDTQNDIFTLHALSGDCVVSRTGQHGGLHHSGQDKEHRS